MTQKLKPNKYAILGLGTEDLRGFFSKMSWKTGFSKTRRQNVVFCTGCKSEKNPFFVKVKEEGLIFFCQEEEEELLPSYWSVTFGDWETFFGWLFMQRLLSIGFFW